MKKKTKIILIFVTIIVLFITSGNIDYSRVKKGKTPILAIKIKENDWLGFGYAVKRCENYKDATGGDGGKYKMSSIISGSAVCVSYFDVEVLPVNDYKIVDETKSCKTALEEIAKDKTYVYYLDCVKSESIFLEYENGNKIKLKVALASGTVDINDLIDKGLEVYQKRITEN